MLDVDITDGTDLCQYVLHRHEVHRRLHRGIIQRPQATNKRSDAEKIKCIYLCVATCRAVHILEINFGEIINLS